jgi:hypothetical protein
MYHYDDGAGININDIITVLTNAAKEENNMAARSTRRIKSDQKKVG